MGEPRNSHSKKDLKLKVKVKPRNLDLSADTFSSYHDIFQVTGSSSNHSPPRARILVKVEPPDMEKEPGGKRNQDRCVILHVALP